MAESKLRWGIMSTANIARATIRAIGHSRNGVVSAIASRDKAKAEAWAQSFGIPLALGSYQELLECGRIDAVYIPLPNTLHAQWSIAALEAGLPVLCEKPLAIDADQAGRMLKVAQQRKLLLAEGFMYRFHPLYDKLFELLRSGAIGKPVSISSRFTFMDDDPNAIVRSAELGGGALLDVGCYCVNLSRWVAGCEPERVFAIERRGKVDEVMLGLMQFHSGLLAQFETGIAATERHGAEIVGEEGTLVLERPWHPGEQAARLLIRRWDKPDQIVNVAGADAYQLQVEHFADVCLEHSEPRWDPWDAVANMKTIDALFAAALGENRK